MVFSLVGTKGIRLWLFCSFARVRLIFAWDNFFLHFLHKTGWLQSSISGDAEEMLAIIIIWTSEHLTWRKCFSWCLTYWCQSVSHIFVCHLRGKSYYWLSIMYLIGIMPYQIPRWKDSVALSQDMGRRCGNFSLSWSCSSWRSPSAYRQCSSSVWSPS